MADRRCPYCGELVPSNSVTCPKCFKKIPVEPQRVEREQRSSDPARKRDRSRTIALLLTLIPGLIGLLGLGLIFKYPRKKRGYVALVLGLLVFVAAVLLTVPFFTIFLAVPLWIVYALMYIGCVVLVGMDNIVFRMASV